MEKGRTFGYARVSSREQNLDRQIDALKKEGVLEENIVIDKASGKDFNREGYQSFKSALGLRAGDTLIVKSIDRLGRNKKDIINEFSYWKDRGVKLKIIDIATTMKDFPEDQQWVQEMINNLLIEVYTSMAQKERETIRQRQAEGIQAAKDRGKHLGRYKEEINDKFTLIYINWKNGAIKAVDAMKLLNIAKTRFYRTVKLYEEKKKKENKLNISDLKKRYINNTVYFIDGQKSFEGEVLKVNIEDSKTSVTIQLLKEYDFNFSVTNSFENEKKYVTITLNKCHLTDINTLIN